MLDLRASQTALDVFHRRFLDDGLPGTLSSHSFQAFDARAYDAEMLERGRRAWESRALDEYRSQLGFSELLVELGQVGLAFDVLGTCVRVVRDEARHVELCRRMVAALGGDLRIPGEPTWVFSDKRLPSIRRVLRSIVGSLCIGETLSVRMIGRVRDTAVDPLAREVMTCLLADESVHSRFGWSVLEAVWPHVSADDRSDIIELLPHFLASAKAAILPEQAASYVDANALATGPAHPFGSFPVRDREGLFHESLERDVLAPFEELGIPARVAKESES